MTLYNRQVDEVGLAVVPGGALGTTAVFASLVPRPLPSSRTVSSAFSILGPPFRRLLKNGAFANGTGWVPVQLDRRTGSSRIWIVGF
jgi:hypothetical protein